MDHTLLALLVFNMAYIAALPFLFFRRDGSFNLKWWMTGFPFLFCAITLILASLGYLESHALPGGIYLKWVALALSVISISLISFTWGTNRVPLSLWHQENDAPQHIVTYGAYKRIRHPFYTSFLIALTGAFLFFPHALTLYCLAHAFVVLSLTAKREEARLSQSEFGSEYKAYMTQTGRFWPKF